MEGTEQSDGAEADRIVEALLADARRDPGAAVHPVGKRLLSMHIAGRPDLDPPPSAATDAGQP